MPSQPEPRKNKEVYGIIKYPYEFLDGQGYIEIKSKWRDLNVYFAYVNEANKVVKYLNLNDRKNHYVLQIIKLDKLLKRKKEIEGDLRLKKKNPELYERLTKIVIHNSAERYIRGLESLAKEGDGEGIFESTI